ncbi:hypothetical protein OPT61_g6824 [Boeremia exigua]|uniref:Uncharacterized protein n=1 Tax=Boeremia exigua TaxID=749465 RepID=A0ACC2I4P0_9PLEO|nr:hypothetical protein OPT61_g6824 [Boeremia exigua]
MTSSNPAARATPRISAQNAQFATVLVGKESVPFVVHEALLTHHSPFFRAALNGGFEEATTKTVHLTLATTKIFEFFVHWLYYQRIPNNNDDPDLFAAWESVDDKGFREMENLIHLDVFCEQYDVPSLKRLSLNHLFEHLHEKEGLLPRTKDILYAYKNMPDDSPLCLFIADFHRDFAGEYIWAPTRWQKGEAAWVESDGKILLTFFAKVLQRYTQSSIQRRAADEELDICDYHEHKDAKGREACAAKRATIELRSPKKKYKA